MPDAAALVIVAVLLVLMVGLWIGAFFLRGWIFRTILGRVRRDLDRLDVVRDVTGDQAPEPRNFRESLFAAMSGKEPRQPAAWRRGGRKPQEPWSEATGLHEDAKQ